MRSKIDLTPILTDPLHPARVLFYVICATLFLVPLQGVVLRDAGWNESFGQMFTAHPPGQPAQMAGWIEVQEGILQFSGQTGRGAWTGEVTTALAEIITLYLIGPALLVWGVRARARYRQNAPVRGGATGIALALAFGGYSLLTIIPAPVYAIVGSRTHSMMLRDCSSCETMDVMSIDLYRMAHKAQVVYFLSGNGRDRMPSWLTADGSGKPIIGISSVLTTGERASEADSVYVSGNGSRFILHVERADSLTIHAIGVREWSGTDENTVRGKSEKLEMCAGVTPDHVNTVLVN